MIRIALLLENTKREKQGIFRRSGKLAVHGCKMQMTGRVKTDLGECNLSVSKYKRGGGGVEWGSLKMRVSVKKSILSLQIGFNGALKDSGKYKTSEQHFQNVTLNTFRRCENRFYGPIL